MQTALLIAVPGGAAFTLFAWSLSRLSSDAVALALGLTLGVLSLIPSLWLVTLARRRDSADYDEDSYIDVQPTYAEDVTPYYQLARRAMGMPALPERQAQIAELEAYLDHLKAQRDPRQFVVRWEGETR